jgi:lipoprotein-anchoring transpeptidase ErfK/SrfK
MPIRRLFFAVLAFAIAISGYARGPDFSADLAPSRNTTPGGSDRKWMSSQSFAAAKSTDGVSGRLSRSPAAVATSRHNNVAAGNPSLDQDTVSRLQIFLDEHSYGPGKIDGRWGEFVGKALQRFQAAHGQQPSGQIDPALGQELQKISPIYTTYTLSESDLRWFGKVPSTPAGMAQLKRIVYRSALDFIAERYHSDPEFIRKLNSGQNLNNLKKGSTVRVPNVQPFQIETVLPVPDVPPRPEFGQRTIRVDTRSRMLDLVDTGQVIASFPITPGSKTLPAPIGTWKVVKVTIMPIFRWDEAMLNHGQRSSHFYSIPAGPRNPVGIVWIGLNKKGIGIHGTDSPDTIGRSGSHGCIRLANWDAARVVNQVTVGMTVEID